MFVAGVANAITAFFGHRVGAVAMQNAQIELLMVSQMLHTGDEGVLQQAFVTFDNEVELIYATSIGPFQAPSQHSPTHASNDSRPPRSAPHRLSTAPASCASGREPHGGA